MFSEYYYNGRSYFVDFYVFDDGSIQIEGVYTDEDQTDEVPMTDEMESHFMSEIESEI
jgi:hypothetical protein